MIIVNNYNNCKELVLNFTKNFKDHLQGCSSISRLGAYSNNLILKFTNYEINM